MLLARVVSAGTVKVLTPIENVPGLSRVKIASPGAVPWPSKLGCDGLVGVPVELLMVTVGGEAAVGATSNSIPTLASL